MNKTKQLLWYFGINVPIMALAYFGFVEGIEWCDNMATFLIPCMTIFTGVVGLGLVALELLIKNADLKYEDALKMKTERVLSPIPKWFDFLYDAVLFVGLVVLGHGVLGFMALITLLVSLYAKSALKRIYAGVDKIIQRENGDVVDQRLERLGAFNDAWDTEEEERW